MTEGVDNSIGSISEQLRQAASQGQFDLVKDLVKNGAKFSSDEEGRTVLHYAALNGHVEICKFLLQQGCSIDDRDSLGYTPLHRAASKGHVEAIELLLNSKCDADSQDEHGNGVIHESAWNGFSQTLELLIKHNCNVILTNKSGFTALHLASQNGHNQSARVLLYGGCNSDLKNNYGDTALHTAARYGHAGVTRILISARCRLNEQNKNGDTALHISAALRRKKIAKLLVEAGIDISMINKQEETAIDVARRKDHPDVIMTITSFVKTKASVHPNPKVVNFSELPVDIDGPVVCPDEDIPVKSEKSGSKLLSFFKKKKKEKDKPAPSGSQVHPSSGKDAVHGFFSHYVPKAGQQYYRDLAGNIKQGPVGYTPICQCMPAIQKLEKRVDKDKEHIYEHIDASHKILKNRMDQLDRKTMEQMGSIDRWSRDRFDEEERNCFHRIDQRLADQQHYMAHKKPGGMDVDDWLEAKLSEYGHCLNHHHDDTALPSNNIFTDIHQTENGRLFRSRSDETLSQSDNHSGRFRKRQFYESRQQAMQQIRAWQVPTYSNDRPNRNPVVGRRYNSQGVPQTFNNNSNPQSGGQNFMSPVPSHQNTRSSSRPEFISPSTASTSRSPYLSHDPIYGSQYNGYDQGAIPKKLPTSKTWHGANELKAAVNVSKSQGLNAGFEQRATVLRESSPLNHSTPNPKSQESSPFEYPPHRSLVKGKTEPEILTPRQSEIRNVQSESRTVQGGNRNFYRENKHTLNDSRNVYGDSRHVNYNSPNVQNEGILHGGHFDRQNEVRRSNIETRNFQTEVRNSDTRRSFPERGSSNTSTGTNVTSNSSSTGQGPLTESSSGKRPTFTTFGYSPQDNTQTVSNQQQPDDSGNNPNTAQPNTFTHSVHQSESPYGYQSEINRIPQTSDSVSHPQQNGKQTPINRVTTPVDRISVYNQQNVNIPKYSAINSVHNMNRDDMYINPGQNMQINRQRSRSSDGILLEDDLTSAYQMNTKTKELSSSQQPIHLNSPRGQAYNVQLESIKRSSQIYGSARSYSNERNDQGARSYSNERNDQGARSYSNERNDQGARYYSNDRINQSSRPHANDYSSRPYPQNSVNRNVQSSQYSVPQANRGYSANGQLYSSMRDVQSNRQYNGQTNRDRPPLASDNKSRENPYGTSQNFERRANEASSSGRTMYNGYNPNYQGSKSSIYNDHSNVHRISSKTESNIIQSSNGKDVYPNADRNLQSTPIQDKSREDNSSNPDSGYSSKIFGHNTNSGNAPSTSCTPSSSFSTEPTDHNITLSSNNSPHPQVNHADYAPINSVRKEQYQNDLSDHVQQWYQKKLKDAAKNLNDGDYVQSNVVNQTDRFGGYDYVQPSQQMQYHGNQRYSNYLQVPNFIRGSDV